MKRQRFLSLLSGTLILGFLCQEAAFCWDRPAIKSYEIESQVYQLCHQSDQLISSRNYSQAMELLRQASSYDPTSYSPYVHDNIAECYRGMKQYPQAIKECETALKFDPTYGAAQYELALSYYDTEQFDTAAQCLNRLMQTSTDRHWIQQSKELMAQIATHGKLTLASNEIDKGHLDRARQLLQEAAMRDPSLVSGYVHSNLAYVLRQSGNPEEAIVEAKKSLKYKPDHKEVIYTMAISYQDIGKFNEAITWLQRYCELETDAQRRSKAQELISGLNNDKDKQNDAVNSLPDYLEHMVGGDSLKRWPQKSLPIKIFVNNGSGVRGFHSQYPSYVNRALDTWCNASGSKLSYKMVKNKEDADIEVAWISHPITMMDGGKKRTKQGIAHVESDDDDSITHVLVEVDCMSGFEPEKELEPSEAASVSMHELGHALGLDHSTNYSDIMYFGASAKQKGLPTSRDKKTIARLYGKYSVSNLAPPEKEPEPMRFVPPPAFVPPKLPSTDELTLPVFLPPPLTDDSEKLTPPPFFQPPPLKESERKPPPPSFVPPALKPGKNSSTPKPVDNKKPSAKTPAKKEPEPMPFFIPPKVK